jgi:hypothetical protein
MSTEAFIGAPVGHVYRMSWWFRGFAIFFLIFGGFFLYAKCRDALQHEKTVGIGEILVSVVLPLAGLGMTAPGFASRLEFSHGSVERVTLLNREAISLSSIRGRRQYVARSGRGSTSYLRLERNDGYTPIDFGKKLYQFDDDFWAWFNALPDLDAMDKVKHKDSNSGLV